MKITIPEIDEYADVLEVLENLPKSVRIKIVAQAIREYKESGEGGAVINLLRKQKSKPAESKRSGGKKVSPDINPLEKIMGGFSQ